jgi:hypothetical protein
MGRSLLMVGMEAVWVGNRKFGLVRLANMDAKYNFCSWIGHVAEDSPQKALEGEPLTAWNLAASLNAGVLRGSKEFILHQTQFQLLGRAPCM